MMRRHVLILVSMLPFLLTACMPAQTSASTEDSNETLPSQAAAQETPLPQPTDQGWPQSNFIEGPVYSLDWSSDSRWIASAGWGQVIVWEAFDGAVTTVLDEPESFVWSVAWSPDSQHLAAAGVDGVVRIWSTSDFLLENQFGTRWVLCVKWSPEGDRLAVGYQGGDIEIIDWRSGDTLTHMRSGSLVISLDWSADGQLLASGSLNGEVSVWEATTGEEQVSFSGYTQARSDANGVAWSPDGDTLASAHQDGFIRLWDIAEGELLQQWDGHAGWVRGLDWSEDGQFLASSGYDSNVLIWSVQSGEIIMTFDEQPMPVWAVVWSPDQRTIASGSGFYDTTDINGEIWVWEISPP